MAGKNQMERILYFDQHIRDGRYPERSRMAEYFEVTEKTISRDIEFLRDRLGAPVMYDRNRKGYYYSDPGFLLPRIYMKEAEALELVLTQWMTGSVRGTPLTQIARSAWKKIADWLPDSVEIDLNLLSRYLIIIDRSVQIQPDIWHTLFRAARSRTKTNIVHYSAARNTIVNRTIHPYRLVHHRSAWYVIGWDEHADDIRVFAIGRIQSVEPLNGHQFPISDFDPDEYIDVQLGVFRGGSWFTAVIRADASIAGIVQEHLPGRDHKINIEADNSLTAEFRTNQREELLHWILQWQDKIELLEPADLRDDLRTCLRNLCHRYRIDSF